MTLRREMHASWTETLQTLQQSGVSGGLLGRVLGRAMRGGGVRGEPVSRIEITRGSMNVRPSPLSPGTVGKATEALIEAGLLEISEKKKAGRGPVVPLTLSSHNWVTVGVHLEFADSDMSTIRALALLCHLNGTVIHTIDHAERISDPASDNGDRIADMVSHLVQNLLETTNSQTMFSVLGIGVEIGAHVRSDGAVKLPGDIARSGRPTPIAKPLFDSLNLPVVVENDVTCTAIRQFYLGAFDELDAALVQVYETGVGGAALIDGRVYRGGSGMSMEIGHLKVESATVSPSSKGFGRACMCGDENFGHVDCIATPARICEELGISEQDFARAGATPGLAAVEGQPNTFQLTSEGLAFRRAGTALGQGLAQAINILNPSQLILRLPRSLGYQAPLSSANLYREALETSFNSAFSTGASDARHGGSSLHVEEIDPNSVMREGALSAAVAVLHAFVEHAQNRDNCFSERSAEDRLGETAP